MTEALTTKRTRIYGQASQNSNVLILTQSQALDQCPAAVYLSQLKQSSRRPQKQALDLVATLLTMVRQTA
jgi:hypothetical protein